MCRLIMAALVAVLLPVGAAALPPPMAAKAEFLIKRLGSNDYYEREAATKALRALGKPALPALRVARDSKDAEVRKRARRLVEVLTPVQAAFEPVWVVTDLEVHFVEIQFDTKLFILHAPEKKKP